MNYSEYTCTHDVFFNSSFTQNDLCQISHNSNCHLEWTFANFYSFTYCGLNGSWGGFIPLGILFIFIIFRFIGSVVEGYLAPAIAYATDWLKLSEAMGAVTLLALANGAGDVVTAIVASTSPQGINYNIGALFGSGIFVTTIVVGLTIINSGPEGVQLGPMSIYRDVGFYILSTILIIIFGGIGNLGFAAGFILIGLYVILVLVVYAEEKYFQHDNTQNDHQLEQTEAAEMSLALISQADTNKSETSQPKGMARFKKAVHKVQIANLTVKIYNIVLYKLQKIREKKEEESNSKFIDKSIQDKIFFIIDQPFVYARMLTIPPAEEKEYNKYLASISITFGLILISWIITISWNWWQLYAVFPLGLILSIIILLTSETDHIPSYYILLQVFTIFSAIMWTYLASGILIDLLNFVGMITNLSKTYLGLTIIAMGNALPDALTTITLSKQGLAVMGMTGAFAGQLFGLLIGLGLAIIKLNSSKSTYNTLYPNGKDFQLFISSNTIEIIVIFTILTTLSITFGFGLAKKFKFNKLLAYILISAYATMFIVVTSIAIYQAST